MPGAQCRLFDFIAAVWAKGYAKLRPDFLSAALIKNAGSHLFRSLHMQSCSGQGFGDVFAVTPTGAPFYECVTYVLALQLA